ncbi:MAG TPA: hypothetical protein PK264_10315 [Hyphomicrobiaceae bacterium]|nr:hypothetical protein [Hyphomicrobiaceae bacterium]
MRYKSLTACCAVAAFAGVAISGAAVHAEPSILTGDAIKATISGRTVNMHTPVGTIPVVYRANGTMIGIAKDMSLYTGQERDKGTWWISGDKLCQRWQAWLDGRQHCVSIKMTGQTFHWVSSDGRKGSATISH